MKKQNFLLLEREGGKGCREGTFHITHEEKTLAKILHVKGNPMLSSNIIQQQQKIRVKQT